VEVQGYAAESRLALSVLPAANCIMAAAGGSVLLTSCGANELRTGSVRRFGSDHVATVCADLVERQAEGRRMLDRNSDSAVTEHMTG
jgi:hypothetical protein